MRITRQVIGLLALGLLVAGTAQAGLVTNGDFDADVVAEMTQFETVSNWTTTTKAHGFNPGPAYGMSPYSEQNFLYLENSQGGSAASQAITMVEGQQYKITARVHSLRTDPYVNYFIAVGNFDMSDNYFGVSDYFSGGIWTSGPSGNNATEWVLVESAIYTATAADAAQGRRLGIGTYNGTASEGYVCFDNVDIVMVPEPTTMGLLGLGGLLTLIRRKRA